MTFQDFQLSDSGDLQITNGDFIVAPSDYAHIQDIITSFQGEWKQYPLVGCGIIKYLKSQSGAEAINICKTQLQADGYSVANVSANIDEGGNLKIAFPNGISRP
jgi:hypothetical protein